MKSTRAARWSFWALSGGCLLAAIGSTGCQSTVGGQSLPSAYYYTDDVQYYSPSQEFKLAKEVAAMKSYKADQQTRQQQP